MHIHSYVASHSVVKYYNGPVWLHCPISYPVDASPYLGMLTMTHRQTWLFSSTSTYQSAYFLTARGVAHLVVHGTSGSTRHEMIPPVRLETSVGVPIFLCSAKVCEKGSSQILPHLIGRFLGARIPQAKGQPYSLGGRNDAASGYTGLL